MTAERIEQKLKSRKLSQTTFVVGEDEWVVWLWAADDPGYGVAAGTGEKYEDAFRNALEIWDEERAGDEEPVSAVVEAP